MDGIPEELAFRLYAEHWAVRRIGGQQAAGVAGSIATYSAIVDKWSVLCRRFGRSEVASSADLDWLFAKLTGFNPGTPADAVARLRPDAMRVLFELAPGPREGREGGWLPVLDTVCQAPAGFERMSAFSSERLHQLGLWLSSPDGPRAVHLLSGTRGAGKSEFIKSLREGYLERARSIEGKPYWPLCMKLSISPALVTGRDVVGALLSQLVQDASRNYWESMGLWGKLVRPVIAFNGMVLALARFAHQNLRLLKLVAAICLLVLLVTGFFLGLRTQSPLESSSALLWLPIHLPVDQLSIFATVFTLLSSLGLLAIGYAYRCRSPLKSSDVEKPGTDDKYRGSGRNRLVRGAVALVGFVLLFLSTDGPARIRSLVGTAPLPVQEAQAGDQLFLSLALALGAMQALMYLLRRWTRRGAGAVGVVAAAPNGAYKALPIPDVGRFLDELLPALIGLSLLAVLALVPTSQWADATPLGLFGGSYASFHLFGALLAVLLLWTLLLPNDRYLLGAIEVSAGNLAEESQQAKKEMPSPVWAWASKILPNFGNIDSTQHVDARAQEALVQICRYSAQLYERVIVLVDDVDILDSKAYPEVLRALRPLIKAGKGVVAVVGVPPSFHHAFRIGLMNDVHSTVRDEILLAPRSLFDTVERLHARSPAGRRRGEEIHALRPGCILVNGEWRALPSQLALKPELVLADDMRKQRRVLFKVLGDLLRASSRLPLGSEAMNLMEAQDFAARFWRVRIYCATKQMARTLGAPDLMLRRMGPSLREWKRWLESLLAVDRAGMSAPLSSDDVIQVCTGVVDSVPELARAMESVLWFESLSEDIFTRKAVSDFAAYIEDAENPSKSASRPSSSSRDGPRGWLSGPRGRP